MKRYKGYDAQVVYDSDARVFHGTVANIRGAITFEGTSVDELEGAFHESVDVYLEFCAEAGVEPAKPFSGNFVLRTTPDLHARAASAAAQHSVSLNAWVVRQLEHALSGADVSAETRKKTTPAQRTSQAKLRARELRAEVKAEAGAENRFDSQAAAVQHARAAAKSASAKKRSAS